MVWPTEHDTKLSEFNAMELPGQQLPASHADTSLDHVLNLDINASPACQRLTGIIATMGQSTYDLEVLERMISSGMNMALLNLNFGSKDEHLEAIKLLRLAAKNYSSEMGRNYPLAIAIKLSGQKIRTGIIANSYGEAVELKTGETVRLTTDETYKDRCSTYTIYIDFMYFADQVNKGDYVLLDNENIMLKVEVISSTTLTCMIERGGFLGSNKDVFVPNVSLDMPSYSERDREYIAMAISNQLDVIVAPYSLNAIMELKSIMGEKGKKIAIVANIQTIEGFRNFDDILAEVNGIMITRQELGSDITPKKLVVAQKNMISRANKANVPVCLSAHLLSSMRNKRVPLRSELLDIANCILDGVDALVLSAETAVGEYPIDTVVCLAAACKEAEACVWSKQIFHDFVDKTPLPCDQATGTAMAAVLAAQRLIAAAIIVVTSSGKSAQIVSKFRPRCPIIAVTRYGPIARQLHLWKGIMPLLYEGTPDIDWQVDLNKRVTFCTTWAMERGFVRVGDPLVVISGWKQGTGYTNSMRIMYAEADVNTEEVIVVTCELVAYKVQQNYKMDQEIAKKLLIEGGTFVFLGVPQETQFGIDMQCWNTDEDFRGIKMIPPGLHYIHYSGVSKGTGDVSLRSGFMHFFQQKEFLVKLWDKNVEDMSKDEVTDESIQRLKDNLLTLDRHLGPYPYDIWEKWKLLSSQITEDLANRFSPENGIIRASVELMSTSDKDRPRGVRASTDGEEKHQEGKTDAKRAKRITAAEKEDSMLPNLKPVPGASLRFTVIPQDKYPPGSTPGEITKHYLDQSYTLEVMIAQHVEPLNIIGELQFAYLCFLIGHSLDAFEHWKNLVILLCSCDEAIHKYRSVYFHFIRTIEIQIDEMPEDFLADIVMNRNLVYKKLRDFFKTAYMSKVDGRLLTMIERFKENLTDKLQWDFTGLDHDEEDERPVIVKIDEPVDE